MGAPLDRQSPPPAAGRGSAGAWLEYHGGLAGTLAPFLLFLVGVGWLGLSGAPDERGFWPVLLAALALGLLLARDRTAYATAVVDGMSRPIVMLMVLAWLLAGVLGALMTASGFVEALVWLCGSAGLAGGAYTGAAFLICCAVSTATGTSLGTILICAPLLYPPGGALGSAPVVLMGAILGGATFGDNLSPVSDTTIASATSQGGDLGGVVRSRLKLALPAAAAALVAYGLWGGSSRSAGAAADLLSGSPRGLVMLAAPALTLWLLLRQRHLVEGLLTGTVAAVGLGLATGLLRPTQLLHLEPERFTAGGLIVEGMERAVGVSIFTLLLMGLVAGVEGAGLTERLVALARRRVSGPRSAEVWTVGAVAAAVLLTTHSVVAILAVGPFARQVGERFGVGAYRRANLLDVTVCTLPFLLPYFIPTILAASTSASGAAAGLPRLNPLAVGLHNFHSWALAGMLVLAVATGYGRRSDGPMISSRPGSS